MSWRTAMIGAALCCGATDALAQATLLAPVSTPPPAGAEGITSMDGTVRQFILTGTGDLDGIILTDGSEVHTPVQLSRQLATVVKPGDEVHVEGWRSSTPGVIAASSITDARTGKAVVNPLPPSHAAARPPSRTPALPVPGAIEATVKGRVMQDLHSSAGGVDGALLGDGMQLRLPPAAGARAAALFAPGQMLTARGYALSTQYGQVMAVQAIGASPDDLTQIAPGEAPPPVSETAPAPAAPPSP